MMVMAHNETPASASGRGQAKKPTETEKEIL